MKKAGSGNKHNSLKTLVVMGGLEPPTSAL